MDGHASIARIAWVKPAQLLHEFARPWPLARFLLLGALLVGAGTLYCLAYCAIAFSPMHGMPMPLSVSVAWAFSALAPWLACFELSKRLRALGLMPLLFALAAFVSILLELGLDQLIGAGATRPLSMQLADQLPAALLTATAIVLARSTVSPSTAATQPRVADSVIDALLAQADRIDWIEAAGNYVEVHAGGRVQLHRVTMRSLESALDPSRFLRVHRSTIVNADQVEGRVNGGGLRMKDGTLLRVGSRYGGNLGAARR